MKMMRNSDLNIGKIGMSHVCVPPKYTPSNKLIDTGDNILNMSAEDMPKRKSPFISFIITTEAMAGGAVER